MNDSIRQSIYLLKFQIKMSVLIIIFQLHLINLMLL